MSFMERYRKGEIPAAAIGDYIREWHVSDLAPRNLLEHLGLSPEEYAIWQKTGKLPAINLIKTDE